MDHGQRIKAKRNILQLIEEREMKRETSKKKQLRRYQRRKPQLETGNLINWTCWKLIDQRHDIIGSSSARKKTLTTLFTLKVLNTWCSSVEIWKNWKKVSSMSWVPWIDALDGFVGRSSEWFTFNLILRTLISFWVNEQWSCVEAKQEKIDLLLSLCRNECSCWCE